MKNVFAQAILMGIVAGMRSMSAPALVSQNLSSKKPGAISSSPLDSLHSENVAAVLTALAAGEMIADKMPGIPARTEISPLIGRTLSGALCGVALCKEKGENLGLGGLLGGLAAVGSTYGCYYLRRWLSEEGAPDVLLGFLEDVAVVSISAEVLSESE